MAKKIDAIKKEMGLMKKGPTCSTCKHFTTEKEKRMGWNGVEFTVEKKLRCGLGGFKIGKSQWCKRHEHMDQ